VDILPDGSLDFDDDTLAVCDFIIAAVHTSFNLPAEQQTARICKALAHPQVTMLAHPTGRLLLEREGYAVNMSDVIEAAARYGKIIELNAHPYRRNSASSAPSIPTPTTLTTTNRSRWASASPAKAG